MKPVLLAAAMVFVIAVPGAFGGERDAAGPWGISGSFSALPFVGGRSGPETLTSETQYNDTFDTGWAFRLEGFRDFTSYLRGQIGLVHDRWGGKHFRGGEFPAGADFDDWDLTALYIGVKARFLPSSRLRPFVLGNIGVARLAPLDVTVNGVKTPYWSETYRDYFNLGFGVEYGITAHIAVYGDLRLEAFGKPDSKQSPLADATGGQTLPVTLGLDYKF